MTSARNRTDIICNRCQRSDFNESRFKCLTCSKYDLCLSCHHAMEEHGNHKKYHSMQCVPTKNELKIFFGGQTQIPLVAQSFACPFCTKLGFTQNGLADHVNSVHNDKISEQVFCPICVTIFADVENMVFDLGQHLTTHHQQPNVDSYENNKKMRIQNNDRDIGIPGPTRVRLNAHFTGEIREAFDPLSAEILSQLSVTRSRTLSSSLSGTIAQNFQINLFPTRFHQFESPRESLYVPPLSPFVTAPFGSAFTNPLMIKARKISVTSSSSSGFEDVGDKKASNITKGRIDSKKSGKFILHNLDKPEDQYPMISSEFQNAIPLFMQELLLLSIM